MNDEEYINYNELEDMEYLCKLLEQREEEIKRLQQENKQLKKHHIIVRPYTNDEVREKIDNYKDNIKQLFETIIEKQKRIDKAIELIKRSAGYKGICTQPETDTFSKLLEILGDKENE